MARLGILRVARLRTSVNIAVKRSVADVTAVEQSSPILRHIVAVISNMVQVARLLFSLLGAYHFLLDLSTIASRRDAHLASSAETLVAGSRARMLATWHDFSANLTTAPSTIVIRLRAALGHLVLATEA